MKVLWAPNIEFIRALSRAARDADAEPSTSPVNRKARVDQRFPLLIDNSGKISREAFDFLYNLSIMSSNKSAKTLSTYAESLCDFLGFIECQSPTYLTLNRRHLLHYRGHLSDTDAANGQKGRQLSQRTINLRLTVANEFSKFITPDTVAIGPGAGSEAAPIQTIAASTKQKNGKMRLLVKVTKKRPRALKQEAINALIQGLPQPHRLAFQWQLCTGLRRGSIVALTLEHIDKLCNKFSDGFIDVPAKGGNMATIYVPPPLLDETVRYIEIDRMKVTSTRVTNLWTPALQGALFLNTMGRPLTTECYYRAFCRACTKIGLKARTHLARATYASRMERLLSELRAQGLMIDPIKIVQGLLGHADSRTTAIYLESIVSRNTQVLEVINSLSRIILTKDENE